MLLEALNHSHSLVTAGMNGRLIGPGNAISDGYLVMYFPIYWFIQNYKGRHWSPNYAGHARALFKISSKNFSC